MRNDKKKKTDRKEKGRTDKKKKTANKKKKRDLCLLIYNHKKVGDVCLSEQNQCHSTGVKKSYFGNTFHLRPKKVF